MLLEEALVVGNAVLAVDKAAPELASCGHTEGITKLSRVPWAQRAAGARGVEPLRRSRTTHPAMVIELVGAEERRGCNWMGCELGDGRVVVSTDRKARQARSADKPSARRRGIQCLGADLSIKPTTRLFPCRYFALLSTLPMSCRRDSP